MVCTHSLINSMKTTIITYLNVSDLETCSHFLEKLDRRSGGLFLSPSIHINSVMAQTHIKDCKPAKTSLLLAHPLYRECLSIPDKNYQQIRNVPYRECLVSLVYLPYKEFLALPYRVHALKVSIGTVFIWLEYAKALLVIPEKNIQLWCSSFDEIRFGRIESIEWCWLGTWWIQATISNRCNIDVLWCAYSMYLKSTDGHNIINIWGRVLCFNCMRSKRCLDSKYLTRYGNGRKDENDNFSTQFGYNQLDIERTRSMTSQAY